MPCTKPVFFFVELQLPAKRKRKLNPKYFSSENYVGSDSDESSGCVELETQPEFQFEEDTDFMLKSKKCLDKRPKLDCGLKPVSAKSSEVAKDGDVTQGSNVASEDRNITSEAHNVASNNFGIAVENCETVIEDCYIPPVNCYVASDCYVASEGYNFVSDCYIASESYDIVSALPDIASNDLNIASKDLSIASRDLNIASLYSDITTKDHNVASEVSNVASEEPKTPSTLEKIVPVDDTSLSGSDCRLCGKLFKHKIYLEHHIKVCFNIVIQVYRSR